MSDELNELANILKPAAAYDFWPQKGAELALAAGYRKPRTVTAPNELDALPAGSVILDRDGDAWQKSLSGWTCTDRALNTQDQPSSSLAWVLSPATVLHEPEAS